MTKKQLIKWDGGKMPVEKGTEVTVEHRCGSVVTCKAGYGEAYDWSHSDHSGDIVAYNTVD